MGNNSGVKLNPAANTTVRQPPTPFRYLPATLASTLLLLVLFVTGAHRFAEPWIYGSYLKVKGAPPLSSTTILVTNDSSGRSLDAQTLGRLAAAILERGPAVVALGPADKSDPSSLEFLADGEGIPPGNLVVSHTFSGFRSWSAPETAVDIPLIMARSLYPLLDGPDRSLNLSMGESLDISDTLITRSHSASASAEPTSGFSAPLSGRNVFTVPAFLRLERGVVASLGVESARRALGVSATKVGYVEGVGILFKASHVQPINARGEAPLRFHTPEGIPRIPASRFLSGKVSTTEVQGKIIFVDPAASGQAHVATVAGPRTPTEIQASVAANLMEGNTVTAPAWGATLPWILGLVFAAIVTMSLILDFGLVSAFGLALFLAVLYPAASLFMFVNASWWLPPEIPAVIVAALFLPFAITRMVPKRLKSPLQSTLPAKVQDQRPFPKERQGGAPPVPRSRAEPRYADPRDPPILPLEPPQEPDLMPVNKVPRPIHPSPPLIKSAPPVASGEDIERDSKGGLVRVGKYRIIRKMGFGSAGDVFEGFDTHMGRKVAIKTITKNAAKNFDRASDRFVLEAKAAGSLNHPNINTIYDFGTIRDLSYMVLEYLDGITLSQWMRNHPTPPQPKDIAHWLQQISSALDYAHSHKIVHRDLKPSNLMVVNKEATIKLLDFGIAKMEDVGLTQTGMTVGTPSYMSPEQLSGFKVGPGSDQYGLAVVIYQLFTYKLPYQGTKIPELCNRILKNEIIPITNFNPSLGQDFWEALRKGMGKLPEDRYPNCSALCSALEAAFSKT